MARHAGRVTWFDQCNGYGFLTCGHEADVFADAASIEWESRYLLKRGDHVQFNIVQSEVGPKAQSVTRIALGANARSLEPLLCGDSAAPEWQPPPGDRSVQHLLLIDDEESPRVLKDEFLTAAGYFVIPCENVQAALEVYKSNLPIDLVIVNLRPSHGQASLLKRLEFLGRTFPVLLSDRTFTPSLWSDMQDRDWELLDEVCPMSQLLGAVRSILRPTRLDAA